MAGKFLHFPVISEGAEYLVMGNLMRRNILAYKAPPRNEGYDLICIHPNPRHQLAPGELAQVRVQVKSRYATDSDRGFPLRASQLDAFDFLVAVFLNIGNFFDDYDGTTGRSAPEFYTLPNAFVREHHYGSGGFERVSLQGLEAELEPYKDEAGFEFIASALDIPRPSRNNEEDASGER